MTGLTGDFATVFMMYMSAQNNLAPFAQANLNEIIEQLEQPRNGFLLYAMKDVEGNTSVYSPKEDGSVGEPVSETVRKVVTDPAVFDRFLERAATEVTGIHAEQKILVLWGHGGGFRFIDETNLEGTTKQASIPVFIDRLAIRANSPPTGKELKFDVVVFDACYMGIIETINDFAGTTKYVVASTVAVNEHGLPYEETVKGLVRDGPQLGPLMAAELVRDTYNEFYIRIDDRAKQFMYLYDIDKLPSCIDAMNGLGTSIMDVMTSGEVRDLLVRSANAAATQPGGQGFRDVLSYCDKLIGHFDGNNQFAPICEGANKLAAAVKLAVLASPGTMGLPGQKPTAPCIWAPIERNSFERNKGLYSGLDASKGGTGGWAKLWNTFHNGSGAPVVLPRNLNRAEFGLTS